MVIKTPIIHKILNIIKIIIKVIIFSLIIDIIILIIISFIPKHFINGTQFNRLSLYIAFVLPFIPILLLTYENEIKKQDALITKNKKIEKHVSLISYFRKNLLKLQYTKTQNQNILYEIKILIVCLDQFIYNNIDGSNDPIFKKYIEIKHCISRIEDSVCCDEKYNFKEYLYLLSMLLQEYEDNNNNNLNK